MCLPSLYKIGGVNNIAADMMSIPIFNKPIIVMGADNAHPAQGEGSRPSVSALVGSVDKFACRYATQIGIQKTDGKKVHSPVIESLQNMVKNMLIKFYQAVRTKPQRIIFYRDGVSEGQFHHVMMYEVDAIKKACMELEKDYNPTITFIVCQKRHHTRLYVQNPRDGDRSGNVPAGTVVDQRITSTTDFDFYLNSHQGIQGTNKPAKYHVLVDENRFPADAVYKLTYHLCHVYARCTRILWINITSLWSPYITGIYHFIPSISSAQQIDLVKHQGVVDDWVWTMMMTYSSQKLRHGLLR